MNNNTSAFFELLRAGLWEKEARLLPFGKVVYESIMRIAEKQSVVGLVAAGLEHTSDTIVPKVELLTIIGATLQIEERNNALNGFVASVADGLERTGINAVLVKGQGVAQCYERPLWRLSGDIDLLVDVEKYEKAKEHFLPLASRNWEERYSKHFSMNIDSWHVEIHGSLRTGLSSCVDRVVDEVQADTFQNNHIRIWHNGATDVCLPSPNNDVFFVFSHYIKHFYKDKLNLRQVCDWCRLLWNHNDKLDPDLLKKWLVDARFMSEWKAFAAFAVKYLEMPIEAMPLYDDAPEWERKADSICGLLLQGYSGKKLKDTFRVMKIIPGNTLRFLPGILLNVNMLKIKERIVGV